MLNAILITHKDLRDALVSHVSGVRQTNATENATFYQKNNFIFAFSDSINISELFTLTLEEYQPEKVFIADIARSVDTDHEIGDIILPNVFLTFNENIITTELTSENRDSLMGEAKFLEIFDEQKDYFVEDFGLSIGGIVVGNTPHDADAEKLLMAYEADIYTENNLEEIHTIAKNEIAPTLIIFGISEGKASKQHLGKNLLHVIAENIMTTIRMLGEDE